MEEAEPRAMLELEGSQPLRNSVDDGDGEGPSPAQQLLVVEGVKPRTAALEMERGRAPRSSVADGGAEPRETNTEWE